MLYTRGRSVQTVYFRCGPILVSFLIETEDGNSVKTVLVGREGAVGGIVSQARLPACSRVMVQFGGDFVTLPVALL